MFTIIEAVIALVFVRAIWDYVKRRAEIEKQSPLAWMLEVIWALFKLALIFAVPAALILVALLYALARR